MLFRHIAQGFRDAAIVEGRPIQFSDGASYDAMMGGWSRLVGERFLEWVRPGPGLDWIDVGCGSGAFTSLVAEQCAPKSILGIDPSDAQLGFARGRGLGAIVRFDRGDAMNLESPDASVDVAVAALVVHFMPDPAKGIAEMARVVRSGGLVAAYAWDLADGGFPYSAVHAAMRSLGVQVPDPPQPEAGGASALLRLWRGARLTSVEQCGFLVTRTFQSFDEYWTAATSSPRIAAALHTLSGDLTSEVKTRASSLVGSTPSGAVSPVARANAIAGQVA